MNGWGNFMRISIDEFEKYYNRPTERACNGTYKTMPQEKRKNADPQLNCTVYEIRLPRFPNEKDARKCFTRLANFLSRNIHYGTVATLGYSTHAKWTPHRFEQGSKGGRAKKVFNDANAYKRPPHIHLNIAGNEAHRVASKLYRNECRLYERTHNKPFPKMQRDVVRSKAGHNLSREYIQWQSTLYREYGSIDDFIKEHDLGERRNNSYYDDEY
jgi:hypothetical protein